MIVNYCRSEMCRECILMTNAIIGTVFLSVLFIATPLVFQTDKINVDKNFSGYVPSVHFKLNKDDGSFISTKEFLKGRNNLLNFLIKESRKTKPFDVKRRSGGFT